MTCEKWLVVSGGLLLLAGLLTAFISAHFSSRVMRQADLGIAVLAPEPGSSDMAEKERQRASSNRWFWLGLILTAWGVVLQTLGAVLPFK